MTREQVISGLRSSPFFWIEFILDNNREAVTSALSGIGYLPASPDTVTRSMLFNTLVNLPDDKLKESLEVPYNNEALNYTGGFEEDLKEGFYLEDGTREGGGVGGGVLIGNIFSGLFNLGVGFFNWKASQEQANIAQAQQQTALLMAQAEKDRRILGMPPLVFAVVAIVVGAVIITAIVVISKRRR